MFDPDELNIDVAPRWTGWTRRAFNADWWMGPVPIIKTAVVAAIVWGIAQWL